ncbi:MAG: hypothetical protein LBG42_02820, partial [Treponema sp.]|nr:hypothetical protein [Treponema sp.]
MSVDTKTFAAKPQLTKGNTINLDIPKEVDEYMNYRFGFRQYFVVVNHIVNNVILHKKKVNKVLVGKEGWLYYIDRDDGDLLADFQKKNLFDESSIAKIIEQIEKRAQWCNDNGIQFIFLIAPNKHSVYPEYYP